MKAFRHITALLACILFILPGHAVQIRRGPGTRIPEYILPTDRDNPALWSVSRSVATKGAAPGYYANNDVPRTGNQEYLMVLVDFQDRKFSIKDNNELLRRYDRMLNEHGYRDTTVYEYREATYYGPTGSVSDYFADQSYGQFVPRFKVVGPVHLSQGYAYYGTDENGFDGNMESLLQEICDNLMENDTIDLNDYSRNNALGQLYFIYAGQGQNFDGADAGNIWPHADIFTYYNSDYGTSRMKFEYACSCELFWDTDDIIDGMGVFCHEFSHTIGLPDFYSSNMIEDAAMGYWSLMDYGNYENGGFSPAGFTAFEKYSMGWLEPEEITAPGQYVLSDISLTPDPQSGIHTAYRLSTRYSDKFVLLENHTGTGWYRYQPAQGLLATAVNYSNNSWVSNKVNTNRPYNFYVLAADNNFFVETNAGDLFPYWGLDSITTVGSPNLIVNGTRTQYSVYGIEYTNKLVSFIASHDMPTAVTGPQATDISISFTDGNLTVTAPIGSKVSVYDISGKPVMETATQSETQQIALPGHGIWLIKCGGKTKKVSL